MSDFERMAVGRLLDQARSLGIQPPPSVEAFICGGVNGGAHLYAAEHPDDTGVLPAMLGCCEGAALGGLADCTCWIPVYAEEQAEPRPPQSPSDLRARSRPCSDCAFRRNSPERSSEWEEEALLSLPESGDPFWCHDGMRKPWAWRHPSTGLLIDADPADYQPPQRAGIPYRADGSPGLLCAGWMARAAKAAP